MKGFNRYIYKFDNFLLDPVNRQLLRNNKPVPLPAKAFDLLHALVENNGRLVEKDELFSSVWQDQIVEESNLTVHISHIRKALGETKNNPVHILTVPGYGYRFEGEVSAQYDETIVETESRSLVTIEHEISSIENSATDAPSENSVPTDTTIHIVGTDSRFRFTFAQKAIVALFVGTLLAAAIVWLARRDQINAATENTVLPETTTQIKRLTSKGTVNYVVLSPDGRFFAYSLAERGAYRSSLWYGQTNGNSDIQLLPAADLSYNPRSFSADGNWIYYTSSEPRGFDKGTLYKLPVLGGVPAQKLLSGISVYAVLSPDETRLAYVRRDPDDRSSSLVIADLDGSSETEVDVLPPGQTILAFSLAWSVDGNSIVFGAENGRSKSHDIFIANIEDGNVRQITDMDWITVSRIEAVKDGSGFLVSGRDKNSFSANQIWFVNNETGKHAKITRDLQHYGSSLSFSTATKSFATIQATRESSIWVAPADDIATARQITFGSSGHEGWFGIDWMPDGRIVYVARIDQGLALWMMDADGGNAKQITSAGFLDERPSVTADGRYIVFQSNRSGSAEIWRMTADGDELKQLTFDGRNSFPHTTPNGHTVLYTHNADGANSVWSISIEGGEAARIVEGDISNARVSPDGNYFACGYRVEGGVKLAVFPIGGGVPAKLFDVPPTFNFDGSIRWARDGRSIAYRDWANGIWSQAVDGGEPKLIGGLPQEKLYHFDWSQDGKLFGFVRGAEIRDAVLITTAQQKIKRPG